MSKKKVTLWLEETVIEEVRVESVRLDRGVSWLMNRAVRIYLSQRDTLPKSSKES